ncbi:hypothetical protein J6590_096056, partial [Homalodisca vitripennis]
PHRLRRYPAVSSGGMFMPRHESGQGQVGTGTGTGKRTAVQSQGYRGVVGVGMSTIVQFRFNFSTDLLKSCVDVWSFIKSLLKQLLKRS